MGKCLITKLNGVVNINNFKYIDAVVVKFNVVEQQKNTNSSIVVNCVNDKTLRVECIKGHFTDSSFSNDLGSVNDNFTKGRLFVSNGAVLKINSKQNIQKISFEDGISDDGNKEIDLDDLKYCSNLESLLIGGNNITGSLEMVAKNKLEMLSIKNTHFCTDTLAISKVLSVNATNLELKGATNVIGDISLLADAIALTNINMMNTGISGNIETLLERMWKKGKKSGTLKLILGGAVSFNGKTHGDGGYSIIVTFSDSSIVAAADITRTFNGSAWVNS